MEHLHGDGLREVQVPRAVDGAERALADALLDEEATAERATDERVVGRRDEARTRTRSAGAARALSSLLRPVPRAWCSSWPSKLRGQRANVG